MVRLFLKNSGTRMDQIRQGAQARDVEESERGAHSLKSSAANIGPRSCAPSRRRSRAQALEKDVETVRRILPELETAYSDAMAELSTIEQGIAE